MSRSRDIPNQPPIKKNRIPPQATVFGPDEDRDQPISFHFSGYNEKQCGIDDLDTSRARGVLKDLKRAGASTLKNLSSVGVTTKPIGGTGEYSKLYQGLEHDVQLFEIVSTGTARIIYFAVGSRFYIRSILSAHLETDKVRRNKRSRRRP